MFKQTIFYSGIKCFIWIIKFYDHWNTNKRTQKLAQTWNFYVWIYMELVLSLWFTGTQIRKKQMVAVSLSCGTIFAIYGCLLNFDFKCHFFYRFLLFYYCRVGVFNVRAGVSRFWKKRKWKWWIDFGCFEESEI